MINKPGLSKTIVLVIIAVAILGIVLLLRFTTTPEGDDLLVPTAAEEATSNEVPDPEYVTAPLEPEESTSSVDTSSWVRVSEDGYEFMHPDYFIRDNGDHYIMAYEPRVGQEFSAIAIFKPVDMEDPLGVIQDKVDAMVAGEVATVIAEPREIPLAGFKSAYLAEYEVNSGPTTGPNKFYMLQSPYTGEWVTIEYAVHPNAEAIRESFKFMPTQ